MKISANYNLGLNYRAQTRQTQAFKGFANERERTHFMDDYGCGTGQIIEKLSDAYGKDLIYIKKDPLKYNEDLRGAMYIVPKGETDPHVEGSKKIEYNYYRPSETEKKEFLRKLTSEIITLHDGSKGSVWSGLDEANQLRERFGDDFDGEYLYNLLDRYHNAQVKNGRFIYTGPYNSKGKK